MYGTEPRILGGRYQLAETIGYGGMAEVYRGHDVRLGREVAVKTLRSDLARDPSFHARFRREAQSAAGLNHPSIVSVYDTGEDNDNGQPVPYIVMEFVEGRTLRDLIAQEGRLMPQRALEIVSDVCGALDYSHRMGIVHRDIKPANVMLTRDNQVKVMDFGIARALTGSSATMTATAQVIGTAQYLSPEQARGEQVDARSDVYSTGVLLYELLTGVPPFRGDSPVAVAYQHVREDPQPPSTLDPDIPPEVDAIVLKALAKNPANRYQTAGEMRDDIERALAGQQVYATPVLGGYDEVGATAVVGRDATGVGGPPTGGLPPEDEGRRRWGLWAAVALAVIAVFVIAALLAKSLIGGGSGGGKVAAPQLQGKTYTGALSLLTHDGFPSPQRVTKTSTLAQRNQVIAQNPVASTQVPKTQVFTLTVGAGPNTVGVPVVKGETQDQATQAIQAAHLRVGRITLFYGSTGANANTVIAQNPASGQVQPNSAVNLTVVADTANVPNVQGQTVQQATAALSKAGFSINQVAQDDPNSDGKVLSQSPSSGRAPRGSSIQITVSHKVAPPTTTPPTTTPPTTAPPTSNTPTPSPTTSSPDAGGLPFPLPTRTFHRLGGL